MPDVFIDYIELAPSQRAEIAQGITDIFCELAGCEPTDVHTRFKAVHYYIGGGSVSSNNINALFAEGADPAKQPNFRIDVQLFPGRTRELKQQITDRLGEMVERAIGAPAAKVEMRTTDLHNENLFIAGGADYIPKPAQPF